jgi:NIMA (never in mitosis gene a)-related kinase
MDQYHVIQLLGKGSEGHVLKCQYKKTQEFVAIKRIEIDSTEKANMTLNEAYRLLSLSNESHPHIVPYKRVFLHKYPAAHTMFVCLVMEYCPYGDLQTAINRYWNKRERSPSTHSSQELERTKFQPIGESVIIRWMIDICEGLNFLHEHGLIHRDLKPNNLFISSTKSSSKNVIKIGDFGTIRAHEGGQGSLILTLCGTPNFMSPEMLNHQTYDNRTDLFSLGIILLEMLTGQSIMLTNELNNDYNLFQKLEKNITEIYGYNIGLFELMRDLVSINPSKRPTAAECLKRLTRLQIQSDNVVLPLFTKESNIITKFDDSLWLHVFQFFDISDLYTSIMLSNKRFYALSQNNDTIWKPLCEKKLGQIVVQKKVQVLPYKEQLYQYYQHQKNCISNRKRSMLGGRLVHEMRPTQIKEVAHLLAMSYQKHPMYHYIFTGRWVDEDIDHYHDMVLSQYYDSESVVEKVQEKPTEKPKLVVTPAHTVPKVITDNTVAVTAESIQAARLLTPLTPEQMEGLQMIMLEMVKITIMYGRVWVLTQYDRYSQSRVVCVSLWQSIYNNCLYSKLRKKSVKSVPLLRKIGMKAMIRLSKVLEWNEHVYNKTLERERQARQKLSSDDVGSWTLCALASLPDQRNQGFASQVMQPVLKAANEDQYPCYATITDVSNLSFFLRLGFVIIDTNRSRQRSSVRVSRKNTTDMDAMPYFIMKRTDDIYVHNN